MVVKLADWAFGRPGAAALKAANFSGVIRYLSNDPRKNLDSDELADYLSHGLTVHVVWETVARRTEDDTLAGLHDATQAEQLLYDLGWQGEGCVYFATDFDTGPNVDMAIRNYYAGAASVLVSSRVGVYGGDVLVQRIFHDGSAEHRWHAAAKSWDHTTILSPGVWDIDQQVQQEIVNGMPIDVNYMIGDSSPVFGGSNVVTNGLSSADLDAIADAVVTRLYNDIKAAQTDGENFKQGSAGGFIADLYRKSGANFDALRVAKTMLGMIWAVTQGNVPTSSVVGKAQGEVSHIESLHTSTEL